MSRAHGQSRGDIFMRMRHLLFSCVWGDAVGNCVISGRLVSKPAAVKMEVLVFLANCSGPAGRWVASCCALGNWVACGLITAQCLKQGDLA